MMIKKSKFMITREEELHTRNRRPLLRDSIVRNSNVDEYSGKL